jgi:hypothetical protein
MRLFEEYVRTLEDLARAALTGTSGALLSFEFAPVLDGAVSRELRQRVSLEDRQRLGAFFTGTPLRARVASALSASRLPVWDVWDPACGAGDLLLGAAEHLPVRADLGETLAIWGQRLFGSDTEPTFVRAARARLVLAAYARGARNSTRRSHPLEDVLPGLRVEDGLARVSHAKQKFIFLNPPYISVAAPKSCEWGSGQVSAAALFLEQCLRHAETGTQLAAILPDVLRSGSRYSAWRRWVAQHANIHQVEVYGRFDPQADVDVFVAELSARGHLLPLSDADAGAPWAVQSPTRARGLMRDLCTVSVGSVVPHRDPETGPFRAYLHSRDASPWGVIEVTETRAFEGKVVTPPFVVVRRTSSPRDKHRAVATIVTGDTPVAIENHLLVLEPHEHTVDACRTILEVLRLPETSEWLNGRIRCRHLTVSALEEVPRW